MLSAIHDVETLVACLDQHGLSDAASVAYRHQREPFARSRALLAESLYAVLGGAGTGNSGLRAGMFRYWHGSGPARERSMQLLSGEESRVTSILSEYGRVVAASAARALANGALFTEPTAALSTLSALLTTASSSFATVVRRAVV